MSTMNRHRIPLLFATAVFAAATLGTAYAAEGTWDKSHPRRAEVNERLEHQHKRIHKEVKEGDLTKAEAAKLHKEDQQIRQEERLMAGQNNGHITSSEQHTLNQQENTVSKQIGK